MALSGGFTLIGKDLIRLLLGPNWDTAGEIFTFFGPGIGIMLVYITQGWIHLSIGKADRWLRWGIVEVVVTCSLFFIALPYGPVGIAVAWTVSFWILSIPAFWYAGKPIDFGVGPIIECVWRFILASLLAASVSAFLMSKMVSLELAQGVSGAAARLATVSVLFTTLYLAAVVALYRGFAPLYQIAKLLREMLPSRRAAASTAPAEAPVAAVGADGPLISILIPAHNAQEWIADTLRSALAQTWQNKEIIVVDDGSTDRTAEIVRQFASEGVRIVSQNNEGASAARNHAFSLSRGEFIQWLDADDLLAPNKIAVQMQAARQFPGNRTLLSSAWGKFMYRYYRAEFSPSELWCDLSPVEWLLRKMGQNLYMQTATWLVSRELAEAAGPWDTRLLGDDDGEYFCRVLMASDGVHFVPEAKVCYRGPGLAFRSLSYIGRSNQKRDAHWLSMQLHMQYLRSLEDSERARTACLRYLQTSLIYFYPEETGIIAQADQLARELGGELVSPRLSWKYAWMKSMFGWDIAKRGQLFLLSVKWWAKRYWDKTLFRLDNLGTRTTWPPHAIVRDPTQRS
jgi:glycosyltransferase involved in cell wall biosynthesis